MVGAFLVKINAMEIKERSKVQKQQIVPFAVRDTLVKKYRMHQGKFQYRWWNETKNCWVTGSVWKNV